jgi:hypothetical protein
VENLTRRCDSRNNANNEHSIEGGMKDQQPKMPRVYVVNLQKRTVKLYLPALKPVFEFYMYYFRGVEVIFTSCVGLQKGFKIDDHCKEVRYCNESIEVRTRIASYCLLLLKNQLVSILCLSQPNSKFIIIFCL